MHNGSYFNKHHLYLKNPQSIFCISFILFLLGIALGVVYLWVFEKINFGSKHKKHEGVKEFERYSEKQK